MHGFAHSAPCVQVLGILSRRWSRNTEIRLKLPAVCDPFGKGSLLLNWEGDKPNFMQTSQRHSCVPQLGPHFLSGLLFGLVTGHDFISFLWCTQTTILIVDPLLLSPRFVKSRRTW